MQRQPYQVEYLILEPDRSSDAVRRELATKLDREPWCGSIAAAGNDTVIKVHVLTFQPEIPIAIGRAAGTLTDVTIEPRGLGGSTDADDGWLLGAPAFAQGTPRR